MHKNLSFPIKDFSIKCDQIRSFLKKSDLVEFLIKNFIFCAAVTI